MKKLQVQLDGILGALGIAESDCDPVEYTKAVLDELEQLRIQDRSAEVEIDRLRAEKAELIAVLRETTVEVVEIRKDIAGARRDNMQGVAHPKFDETAQREFARLDRLIERARAVLAKAAATEGGT